MDTRIAVVGASGIGKHHAKWWTLEGATVCAFVGTSDATVASTRDVLRSMFDFRGTGYTDLGRMLEAERPEIVDVCTPPALHYEHAKAALAAGCHVLCEKPFVYNPQEDAEVLLAQAGELLELARDRDLLLGVCTQYYVAARTFKRLLDEAQGVTDVTEFHGHLASPAKGRPPSPAGTWGDLGPHLLGGVQAVVPSGRIDWGSVRTEFRGHDANAWFDVVRSDGRRVPCEILTDHTTAPPSHVRRIELNGARFDLGGENDENGVYCAKITSPFGEFREPDVMRTVMHEFLAGSPPMAGDAAYTNLEWLLRLLAMAQQ